MWIWSRGFHVLKSTWRRVKKFHLNSMWFPRGHSTWIPHEFHQNFPLGIHTWSNCSVFSYTGKFSLLHSTDIYFYIYIFCPCTVINPMLLNTHLWSEFWVAQTRMKKENLTNLKKRCAACDCWNGNAKAPRPHQFYMRGMNATSAPPAHSLRSSCVNHARFIRNSLATVRWLCVVLRRVFVTHNNAFALFGAFSCLCAEVRGLLVIYAWSFRSSCAIHRWFFIT